jgi:hypothetical protein
MASQIRAKDERYLVSFEYKGPKGWQGETREIPLPAKHDKQAKEMAEKMLRKDFVRGIRNLTVVKASSQALSPTDLDEKTFETDPSTYLTEEPNEFEDGEVEAWYTYQTADVDDANEREGDEVDAWSTIKTPVEPDNAPGAQPQSTLLARMSPTQLKQADLARKTFSILNKVVVDPAIIEHGPDRKLYVQKGSRKYKVVEVGGKYFLDGTKI